jgi:hypothetical protein
MLRTKSARSVLSHHRRSRPWTLNWAGLTSLGSPSPRSLPLVRKPCLFLGDVSDHSVVVETSLPPNQDFPRGGLSSPPASTRSHNFYNYWYFWIESQGKIKPAWIEMSLDEDTVWLRCGSGCYQWMQEVR